jgi:ADP-heptose:LPS heptosyltransferase
MNIAILRRNGLGDLLCAFPLILYLKKTFPECSITLFIDQRNAPLIPYLPKVNHVVVFPAKGNKYWNLYRASRPFRNKFDMAISAKTSPMKLNNFFLYCLRAKERIAYVDDNWHARLINRPIPYCPSEAKKLHQALKGLHTVAPDLREVPQEFYPNIHVPKEIKGKYVAGQPAGLPVVLISATTTKPSNRLDIDRYASILNSLHQKIPLSVRIIGQKNDRLRADAIAMRLQMQVQVHFPRNFDEFMVLLGASDLFFVGDGGVAHIGAALGKHIVALYGETNPEEWRPLSKKADIFYHPAHVDRLPPDAIYEALKRKIDIIQGELRCGRDVM